jgi:type IV pilus assembly protein PilW
MSSVRGPVGSGVAIDATMGSSTATIQVPAGSPFVKDDLLLLVSCQGNGVVFEKTNAAGTTINHTQANPARNSTNDLGDEYEAGSLVIKLAVTSFFVRDSSAIAGTRALWIKESEDAAQALIEGVDGMQILYGVTSNTDTSANQYLTAAQVDAGSLWGNVVNVRIALLVASLNPTVKQLNTTVYSLLGVNYPAFNDLYQRRVFTTTITLRNRSF